MQRGECNETEPAEPMGESILPRAQVGWQVMNRKQRREMMRKMQAADLSLEVVHPDAAGIDIGNEAHYVAVPPPARDREAVRRFGCTTAELRNIADWLKQCRIRTVAASTVKIRTGHSKLYSVFGNIAE
jgi:hypothetical protein